MDRLTQALAQHGTDAGNRIVKLYSIVSLGCRFPGTRWLLDSVSLDIFKGQCAVLAGRNGCGKTLLLKHCLGLEPVRKGQVLYKGKKLRSQIPLIRQEVGTVFQHPDNQIIEQTVRKDAAFSLRFSGFPEKEIETRVNAVLDQLGLTEKAGEATYTLSGGEKRRLALAGCLVLKPEIIFLDEPFTELDYEGVRTLLEILQGLKDDGIGLFIITHDLGKVLSLADRLIVMDKGRIAGDGLPEALLPSLEDYGIRNPLQPVGSIGECTWLK